MKKIFTLSALLLFTASIYPQTEVKETTWQKAKSKCNELYAKAKKNKYAKYAAIGTASALVIGGGAFAGHKYCKGKKEDK